MMKNKLPTEREIQQLLFEHHKKMGILSVREMRIPRSKERVDFIIYEHHYANDRKGKQSGRNGIWKFYEIKRTLSDFKSKCKLSFQGNLNYYVLTEELYNKLNKDDFKKGVGIIVIYRYKNNNLYLEYKKRPKRQELQVDHGELMWCFMKAQGRELDKYRMKEL